MTGSRVRARPSPGDRGTSTTLDVVLFLLLVSAAVGVLAAAAPPDDGHDPRTADRAAELLATTTAAVDQPTPSAGRRTSDSQPSTVHGTLAALLARAAIADAVSDVDSRAGDGRDDGRAAFAATFAGAVAERARGSLSSVDATVNVTASYAPLPGSEPQGRATVGPEVPGDVDVAVARIRVPVGNGPAPAELERVAREEDARELARALADATVATMVPSSRMRWALRDDATRPVVADRYRRLGRSLSVSTTGALDAGRVRRANALLARALADEYLAAIRTTYDTPTAAAATARPRVVVVTVRTWSS